MPNHETNPNRLSIEGVYATPEEALAADDGPALVLSRAEFDDALNDPAQKARLAGVRRLIDRESEWLTDRGDGFQVIHLDKMREIKEGV